MPKRSSEPKTYDGAPAITGKSYTLGVYRWQRGARKELDARPVIDGEVYLRNSREKFPAEAGNVEPLMLVTIVQGVAPHEQMAMLKALHDAIGREAKGNR